MFADLWHSVSPQEVLHHFNHAALSFWASHCGFRTVASFLGPASWHLLGFKIKEQISRPTILLVSLSVARVTPFKEFRWLPSSCNHSSLTDGAFLSKNELGSSKLKQTVSKATILWPSTYYFYFSSGPPTSGAFVCKIDSPDFPCLPIFPVFASLHSHGVGWHRMREFFAKTAQQFCKAIVIFIQLVNSHACTDALWKISKTVNRFLLKKLWPT